MTIGWGIIGTGQFAERVIVPALRAAAGAELRAVCSRDAGRAKEFAGRHAIPAAYGSLDDLFRDDSVQAVWITTPHKAHVEPAVRAAEAGRHIICEKPLATTAADARRMIDAAERHGVRLGTGYNARHHPLVQSARRRIAAGDIGEPVIFRGEWSHGGSTFPAAWREDPELSGGGILTGTGVHVLDAARYILGQDAVAITGFSDEQPPDRPVDEIVAATVLLDRGTAGLFAFTRWSPKAENAWEIQGRAGRLTILGVPAMREASLLLNGEPVETVPADEVRMFPAQVEAFGEAIRDGTTPNASGHDGLRATEMMEGLRRAAQTGSTVRL